MPAKADGFPRHEELRTASLADVARALVRDPGAVRRTQCVLDAARARRADVLTLLLDRGADPNALGRGYRPLHVVIQREPHVDVESLGPMRESCFRLLLERGADPQLPAAWPPARATILAALCGEPMLLAGLLEHGARTDALVDAVQGRVAPVRRAIANDRSWVTTPDPGGLLPLHAIAGSRFGRKRTQFRKALRESAVLLIDAGADPNATARSWSHDIDAAYMAIAARHPEMLALLLERGADPCSALASALWVDAETFGPLALHAGADPDRTRIGSRPVLNELVRWGQFDAARWLLAAGASPNVPDDTGWTALHQAASRGNERMLKDLLAAGGDPRARDNHRSTPHDVAAEKGRRKLMALLR